MRPTALGDAMRDPGLRASLRRLVRHAGLSQSSLDNFRGEAVVELVTGRTLTGTLLGWSGDKLVVRTAGGLVYISRSEISTIKMKK